MKNLLLLFLLFPLFLFSQMNIDTVSKTVSFSKVYELRKTKAELHQLAQEWIAINFKDANEVIKLNTEDKLIAKGYFNISYSSSGYEIPSKVFFVFEVAFKENKYKLDLHTFELHLKEYTLPVENYYFANDYDYYIKILKEQFDNYTDKTTKKYFDKLLNNPDELNKMYADFKLVSLQISNKVNTEVTSTDHSLFNYVSKTSSDSW